MRFVVYGAGALGSLVAARLASATTPETHDVVLVGRKTHVDAIKAVGLEVSGKTSLHVTDIDARIDAPSDAPDYVLLTCKAYDTAEASAALQHYGDRCAFVSLQNGLGNEETLAKRLPRVIGAVINQGVTFVEPGKVFHAGVGETELGPHTGVDVKDVDRLAHAFNEAGLSARRVDDIRLRIWHKAILNAAVNPITALLSKRTGELVADPHLENAMSVVVNECATIASACGITIDPGDVMAKIDAVARATRDNKSSMLQDLERGRRTEIEAINGAMVERAARHGVPAPANQLLASLIRSRS